MCLELQVICEQMSEHAGIAGRRCEMRRTEYTPNMEWPEPPFNNYPRSGRVVSHDANSSPRALMRFAGAQTSCKFAVCIIIIWCVWCSFMLVWQHFAGMPDSTRGMCDAISYQTNHAECSELRAHSAVATVAARANALQQQHRQASHHVIIIVCNRRTTISRMRRELGLLPNQLVRINWVSLASRVVPRRWQRGQHLVAGPGECVADEDDYNIMAVAGHLDD